MSVKKLGSRLLTATCFAIAAINFWMFIYLVAPSAGDSEMAFMLASMAALLVSVCSVVAAIRLQGQVGLDPAMAALAVLCLVATAAIGTAAMARFTRDRQEGINRIRRPDL